MAERETGAASPRLLVITFAHFARFPRPRDHPEGLLAVYIVDTNRIYNLHKGDSSFHHPKQPLMKLIPKN